MPASHRKGHQSQGNRVPLPAGIRHETIPGTSNIVNIMLFIQYCNLVDITRFHDAPWSRSNGSLEAVLGKQQNVPFAPPPRFVGKDTSILPCPTLPRPVIMTTFATHTVRSNPPKNVPPDVAPPPRCTTSLPPLQVYVCAPSRCVLDGVGCSGHEFWKKGVDGCLNINGSGEQSVPRHTRNPTWAPNRFHD